MRGSPPPGSSGGLSRLTAVVPVAAPGSVEAETVTTLETFFEVVATVTESIDRVNVLMCEMSKKHEQAMDTVNVAKCDAIRKEVGDLDDEINNTIQKACKGVEDMENLTKKLKETPEMEGRFAGVIRLEENQRRFVLQKLSETMEGLQKRQLVAEKNYLSQTERRIKIAYSNPDGGEMDDETAHQLAMQVMEKGATTAIFQQSKEVLAQMLETRSDIYRIEMSMRSLNRVFSDLAILVEEQGDLMNVIIRNIDSTNLYMEKAHRELQQARAYQRASRSKLMCLLMIGVIIIALFVAAGLLGSLL